DDALDHVFFRLVHGLRWLWSNRTNLRVTKGALCQGRYRLGARPVGALFHRLCRPLAGPQTRGAFVLGYRFVAIDTQTLDLPDSRVWWNVAPTPFSTRACGRMPSINTRPRDA